MKPSVTIVAKPVPWEGSRGNAALASGQLLIVPQKYFLLVGFWHSATLSGPALLIPGIFLRMDSIDEFL